MKLDEIGVTIKYLGKEKGLTQKKLAELAGLSRVTLGKLERGQVGSITLKTIDIISDALGYELNFKTKKGFSLPILDELQSNSQ